MKARHANIMVDLETLGISPGCTILSIGAVVFNPVRSVLFGKNESLTSEFYCVINRQSCKEAGLFEESKTIAWWDAQSIESKKVLSQADSSESLNIHEALQEFNLFVKKNGGVWLNYDVVLRRAVDDSPEPIKELRRLVEKAAARFRPSPSPSPR